MISITITDLGALPQSERERLADYLRGPVQSKPAEVTTLPDVAPVTFELNPDDYIKEVTPNGNVMWYEKPSAPPVPEINTAAVFAPPVAKPEKDAQGVIWDERIHASTRNMNQDGTWKRRRGTDDVLFAQVMGELTDVPPVVADALPPPPPVTTGEPITTFPALMTRITAAGIPAPTVITAVREVGESVGWENATLPMLGTGRAELIPEVARRLGLV